jgi:hypothetical protein
MKRDGLEVLVDNQYAGATAGEAKTKALNLLDQLKGRRGLLLERVGDRGMLLALRRPGSRARSSSSASMRRRRWSRR